MIKKGILLIQYKCYGKHLFLKVVDTFQKCQHIYQFYIPININFKHIGNYCFFVY